MHANDMAPHTARSLAVLILTNAFVFLYILKQCSLCRVNRNIRGVTSPLYIHVGNLVITVPADVLAPKGARPSAGTVLTSKLCQCALQAESSEASSPPNGEPKGMRRHTVPALYGTEEESEIEESLDMSAQKRSHDMYRKSLKLTSDELVSNSGGLGIHLPFCLELHALNTSVTSRLSDAYVR